MVSAAGVMAASKIQPVPRSIPIQDLCSTSNNVLGSVAPTVNRESVLENQTLSVPAFLQQPDQLPLQATWRSVDPAAAPKLWEICTSFPLPKKRKQVDNNEVGVAFASAINAYNNPSTKKSTLVQDRLGAYVDSFRVQLASSESWSCFARSV